MDFSPQSSQPSGTENNHFILKVAQCLVGEPHLNTASDIVQWHVTTSLAASVSTKSRVLDCEAIG